MASFFLRAPAKINLYLAVIKRRKDGYHDLCTLFQRISLFDEIRITTCGDNEPKRPLLTVSGFAVPTDRSNLIVRAYELLCRICPKTPPISIDLRKNIPVAAGLGGGSSDAGTFLKVMNQRFKLGLSRKKLCALARQLGADVTFFTTDFSCALGTGRGDRVKPVKIGDRLWIVVVIFRNGLHTKEIYYRYSKQERSGYSLTKAKHDVTLLCNYLRQKDLKQFGRFLRNDLEPVCLEMKPSVKRVINFLRGEQKAAVSVSGSGPTCFAILPSQNLAEKLAMTLRRRFGLRVIVTHSL